MLRIHFLPEDLSRTHVVSTSDALWETLLSFQLSHSGDGRLVFDSWRRQVWARAPRSAEAVLLPLSRPRGPSADLLTPAASTLGLDAGLEAVRATPMRLIRQDLHKLAAHDRLPAWTRRLADGEPRLLAGVAGAMRAWHEAAVAPYQDHIDRSLDADRALRLRDARLGGPDRVLAGLPPPLAWRPPTLGQQRRTVRRLRPRTGLRRAQPVRWSHALCPSWTMAGHEQRHPTLDRGRPGPVTPLGRRVPVR